MESVRNFVKLYRKLSDGILAPKEARHQLAADKIVWVKPIDITFKVFSERALKLGGVMEGDWDQKIKPIVETFKYKSMVQHFVGGAPWEETDIFRKVYQSRLAEEGCVLDCSNINQLKDRYESRIDPLYQDMKCNGFVVILDKNGKAIDIPHVHIGRDGTILFGNRGNHRLAIAKLLKLDYIPAHVRTRHKKWEELRNELAKSPPRSRTHLITPDLAYHADLLDLLGHAPPARPKTRSNPKR